MSYHGSRIDEETYDCCRMAMFGLEDLSAFKNLDDKQGFIDWAINETEILSDLGMDETDAREILGRVYDHEVEQYREEDD